MNVAKSKEAAADYHEAEAMAAAKKVASGIEGRVVKITTKGGASGRMFGKITAKEVADALGALVNAPVDKKKVELETRDIKDAGTYSAKVRLHAGVTASFKVQVEIVQG